jgi:hypothetical protein
MQSTMINFQCSKVKTMWIGRSREKYNFLNLVKIEKQCKLLQIVVKNGSTFRSEMHYCLWFTKLLIFFLTVVGGSTGRSTAEGLTAGDGKSFSSGPPGLSVSKSPATSPSGSVAATAILLLLLPPLLTGLSRLRAAVAAATPAAVDTGLTVVVARLSLRRPGVFINPPPSSRLTIFRRPPPPVASIAARLSSSSCPIGAAAAAEGPVSSAEVRLLSSSSSAPFIFWRCRLPVRIRVRSVGWRVRTVAATMPPPPPPTASVVVRPAEGGEHE